MLLLQVVIVRQSSDIGFRLRFIATYYCLRGKPADASAADSDV